MGINIASIKILIDYSIIDKIDSLLLEINSTLADFIPGGIEMDSITNIVLTYEPVKRSGPFKVQKIIRTYHNDRSQQQAEAIMVFLHEKGIPSANMIAVGYGDRKSNQIFKDGNADYLVQVKFFQ